MCYASYGENNIKPLYLKDYRQNKDYQKRKLARQYVVKQTEIVTRLPPSHSRLYEKSLNLQEMFRVMKKSSIYHSLNKKQQKYLITSVPMYKINKAIKAIETMMMDKESFNLLATTLPDENNVIVIDDIEVSGRRTIHSGSNSEKEKVLTSKEKKHQARKKAFTKDIITNNVTDFCLFVSSCPVIDNGYRNRNGYGRNSRSYCHCPFHQDMKELRGYFFPEEKGPAWVSSCRESYGDFITKEMFQKHCLQENDWKHDMLYHYLELIHEKRNAPKRKL